MTDLSQYQPDHLFLLIGKNPLPNYVAAKVLGKKGKTYFYLISSSETKKYAESLNSLLQKEFSEDFTEMLFIEESDPKSIQKKIKPFLDKRVEQGSVGLNYTGGTKVMAVHSYLEIKRLCKDKKLDVRFSYLNPRKLELCFDDLPCRPFKLGDPDNHEDGKYFETASIKLEDLLSLHGYRPRKADQNKGEKNETFKNPRSEAQLSGVATCLFEILKDNDKQEQWQSITKSLSNSPKEIPDTFSDLKVQLKNYSLLNDQGHLDVSKSIGQGFSKNGDFIKWLQGKWLEDYLLKTICELKDRCKLHDCSANLEPAVPEKGNEHKPFFELDVVTLRGYQLFTISCTTKSNDADCKKKLFEVFIRAKQLGGDEARVALVCRNENSDELQHQIEQSWNVSEQQIKIFGKNQLPMLKDLLEYWFKKG